MTDTAAQKRSSRPSEADMDSTVSSGATAPGARSYAVPSERYPFPTGRSRWVFASLFLLGTVCQALEFVIENPNEDSAERVAYWADHATRVGWSMTFGILAVPFLLGGFAVLVALSLRTSRRLSWAAATLLTFAMVGISAIHGLELAAYGLTRAGDHTAAVAVLDAEDVGLPGGVLFVMFLSGALFGVLTLVAATWRSPLVPRAVPVLILTFGVLDFGLGFGLVAHLVNVLAGLAVAWAVVVGYERSTRGGGPGLALPRARIGREPREARGSDTVR
jgi:hypothetical protein